MLILLAWKLNILLCCAVSYINLFEKKYIINPSLSKRRLRHTQIKYLARVCAGCIWFNFKLLLIARYEQKWSILKSISVLIKCFCSGHSALRLQTETWASLSQEAAGCNGMKESFRVTIYNVSYLWDQG